MESNINYSEPLSLRDAAKKAEIERNRLFDWSQLPEFQGEDERKKQIRERIQSKCRSLARICNSLEVLADKLEAWEHN